MLLALIAVLAGIVLLVWRCRRELRNFSAQRRLSRGRKAADSRRDWPLYQDCFIFQVEILELLKKPSVPAGEVGYDAFGKKVVFEDLGDRLKALLNVGMLDVDIYSLTPLFPGI